jgi:hypothetical protein
MLMMIRAMSAVLTVCLYGRDKKEKNKARKQIPPVFQGPRLLPPRRLCSRPCDDAPFSLPVFCFGEHVPFPPGFAKGMSAFPPVAAL